jgi:hypothetical protein
MAAARTEQLSLFELEENRRPLSERTVAGRHREPGLFNRSPGTVIVLFSR